MQVQVNGTRLFYTTHGRGRPLLVLHGGFGLGHAYLRPWLDRLGDRLQLIYYDHRGSGRSAPLGELGAGGIETWAADADALRAHLGHERLLVFGHSFGGFLAQEYAVRYGSRVDGLILCATAPAIHYHAVMAAATQTYLRRQELRPLVRFFARRGAAHGRPRIAGEELHARLARLSEAFQLHDPAALAAPDEAAAPAGSPRDSSVALPIPDLPPTLAHVAAPTLVIAGRRDRVVPPERGALPLHAALPRARLALLAGSGHFPFIEEPEAFTRAVVDWLHEID